jgi:hypothetical protein
MKKLFFLIFAFIFCLASPPQAGTAIKKSGSKSLNNFGYYVKWDFDTSGTYTKTGAAAGTNTDTLVLYDDSATSRPYYMSVFTTKNIQSGTVEAFPDSLRYCISAHDDAADAITLRTEFQVKFNLNASTWTTWGGNGDLALAGSGVPVNSCFTRLFLPGLPWRIIAHVTTTTDSAQVNWVAALPIRK